MNKTELINAMAEKAGLSKVDAKKALDAFVEAVSESLVKGDKVATDRAAAARPNSGCRHGICPQYRPRTGTAYSRNSRCSRYAYCCGRCRPHAATVRGAPPKGVRIRSSWRSSPRRAPCVSCRSAR